ncbi:MAG: hypothetical protein GXY53_04025 [Desulfobulbus sp.]|nr:hypothetical protein [Desulfobulbus sp.]
MQADILGFNLAQLTASGCPPVLDFEVGNSRYCVELNGYARRKVQEVKPDVLIMAGYWSLYNGNDRWDELDMGMLASTISTVQDLGVKKVVVVGHLPTYTVNQTDMLRKRFPGDTVNIRTYNHFKETVIGVNEKIARTAREKGAQFISPLDVLCNSQGCMLSLADDTIIPVAFDYGHLTAEGSTYLVSKLFEYNLMEQAEVLQDGKTGH